MALVVLLFTACNSNGEMPISDPTSEPTVELTSIHFSCNESCSVAKDFLSQFSIIFLDNDEEPTFSASYDSFGNVMYNDVYLVYSMYRLWDNPGYWNFHVSDFSVFGMEGSYEPLLIRMRYWGDGTCSSMGSMLYIKTGNEFRQLGSMISYATPGYLRFQPLINEADDIIVFVIDMEPRFKAINNEGNFEMVGSWMSWSGIEEFTISGSEAESPIRLTIDEIFETLAAGQMQNFISDFPYGNFVPLVGMYDLEQHFWETVPQMLYDATQVHAPLTEVVEADYIVIGDVSGDEPFMNRAELGAEIVEVLSLYHGAEVIGDFIAWELSNMIKTETSDVHRVADGVYLVIDPIPEGIDISEFLRELGNYSFREHEQLPPRSAWRPDAVVLRTNEKIEGLRIIGMLPHDVADFSSGWEITQVYQQSEWVWTTIDLLPHEPFVMGWSAEDRGHTESGLTGIAFTDSDGYERFFILQLSDEDIAYLKEFEDTSLAYYDAQLSTIRPTSELEFVMADISDRRALPWQELDGSAARERFLQQFDHYIELGEDDTVHDRWFAFIANAGLLDFQIFRLGLVCDWYVYVDDDVRIMHPFYIHSVTGGVDVLPVGVPLVVPFSWTPFGSMPQFGVSFTDEAGQFHALAMQENTASGVPPMFIFPFVDRVYCSHCAGQI